MRTAPSARLSVLVEALLLRQGHTGVERFILDLLRYLPGISGEYQFTVLLWGSCCVTVPKETGTVRFVRLRGKSKLARVLFQHFVLPLYARKHSCTLFTGYLGSLLVRRSKSALWVYDLVAFREELWTTKLTRIHYRLLLPHFLRTAATVFCPSVAVQQEIQRYRESARRTLVRRLPVSDCFLARTPPPREPDLPERYYLTIGHHEPKKNHNALSYLAGRFPDETFVIAGCGTEVADRRGPRRSKSGRIVALGFVPQTRLVALLWHCRALVFPSLAEGYGYPVAEAIAVGVPTICYPIPPLKEFRHPLVHRATDMTPEALAAALIASGTNRWRCRTDVPYTATPPWPRFLDEMLADLCSGD